LAKSFRLATRSLSTSRDISTTPVDRNFESLDVISPSAAVDTDDSSCTLASSDISPSNEQRADDGYLSGATRVRDTRPPLPVRVSVSRRLARGNATMDDARPLNRSVEFRSSSE